MEDIEEIKLYLSHLETYELVRLGRELHLNYTNLVRLKHTHSKPTELLGAMMEEWLVNGGEGGAEGMANLPPTWRRLGVALKKAGLSDVARRVTNERVNQC